MAIEISIRKLRKMIDSDPYVKSKLAAALGIATTSTIDKWLQNERIPRLRKLAVLSAIKLLEKKT